MSHNYNSVYYFYSYNNNPPKLFVKGENIFHVLLSYIYIKLLWAAPSGRGQTCDYSVYSFLTSSDLLIYHIFLIKFVHLKSIIFVILNLMMYENSFFAWQIWNIFSAMVGYKIIIKSWFYLRGTFFVYISQSTNM